jgi:hypothetical protein
MEFSRSCREAAYTAGRQRGLHDIPISRVEKAEE